MLTTVQYQNNVFTREVIVSRQGDLLIGTIGNSKFYWGFKQHDLPLMFFKKQATDAVKQQSRYLAVEFVKQYIYNMRELRDSKGKTPVHFQPSDLSDSNASDSRTSIREGDVSGIPPWMRNHKVWTPCHSRTTGELLYYRRTRFQDTEDTRLLVASYLPYCQVCPFRESCELPCTQPSVKSNQEILD